MLWGVAKDTNIARLALVGLSDKPGTAFRIFSLLARKKINVDIILQSIGRNETKDISFTVGQVRFGRRPGPAGVPPRHHRV